MRSSSGTSLTPVCAPKPKTTFCTDNGLPFSRGLLRTGCHRRPFSGRADGRVEAVAGAGASLGLTHLRQERLDYLLDVGNRLGLRSPFGQQEDTGAVGSDMEVRGERTRI